MIDSKIRYLIQPAIDDVSLMATQKGFTPMFVTACALLSGIASSAAFIFGMGFMSFMFLWLSGLLDVIDGSMARISGKSSNLGMLCDLVFDRIVEVVFISAVAVSVPDSRLACVFLLSSIIFSFSIFLIAGPLIEKEKMEGIKKGFYYQAGLAERTETFIVFSFVIAFPAYSKYIFHVFTVMILITGAQRFYEVALSIKN